MKAHTQKQNPVDRPLRRARKMRPSILATSAAAMLSISLFVGSAHAAPDNWLGTTNASWDTTTNWSTAAKPTAANQVTFPAAIPGTGSSISLSAGELADTLSFANGYTLTGGSLTMTTGTISVTGVGGAASVTINSVLGEYQHFPQYERDRRYRRLPEIGRHQHLYRNHRNHRRHSGLHRLQWRLVRLSVVTVSEASPTLEIVGGVTTAAVPLSIAGTGVGRGALFGSAGGGTSTYSGAITLAANATIGAFLQGGNPFNLTGGINTNGSTVTLGVGGNPAGSGNINVNSVISGAGGVIVERQTTTFNASNT